MFDAENQLMKKNVSKKYNRRVQIKFGSLIGKSQFLSNAV